MQGYTTPGIALSLSLSRRTCQEWVKRFNQQGLVGLQDQPGRGRNALLTPEENGVFKKRLDAGPTDADGVCTLQGEDLRRILENEFGKVRSLGTVYDLRHQRGYASLVPRPQHRNADENAQQTFKKVPRNGPSHSTSAPGEKSENLFSGRSAFRTAGDTDPNLGTQSFPTTDCATDAVRRPVGARSGLS